MELPLSDILAPETIIGNTINGWIYFHPWIVKGLYLTALGVFLVALWFMRDRCVRPLAVRKALICSLCCTGILYAAISEVIWARWLIADTRLFQPVARESRPAVLDGDIYRFALECRRILNGDDYMVSIQPTVADPNERHPRKKLEYHLLPSRKKEDARYLIVLYDRDVRFDEKARILYRNNLPVSAATLVYRYNADAYVLRRGP